MSEVIKYVSQDNLNQFAQDMNQKQKSIFGAKSVSDQLVTDVDTIGDALDQAIADIAVLDGRVDNITSLPAGSVSTSADAELVDIRVGSDGTTYASAGDAVRGQVGELKSALENVNTFDANFVSNIVQPNLYDGAATFAGAWYSGSNNWVDDGFYNGLKVKTKTGAWNGIFKLLPITAGKTYTFSALIKTSIFANVTINLYQTLSGYETTATVDVNTKSITVNAEEWVEVYITFVCTASGTIAPRVEAAASYTLSIAGYKLYEGEYNTYSLPTVVEDVGIIKYDMLLPTSAKMATFELGSISATDGTEVAQNNKIRTTNFLLLKKGTKITADSESKFAVFYYSKDGTFSYLGRDTFRTSPLYIRQDVYVKIAMGLNSNASISDITTVASTLHIDGYVAESGKNNIKRVIHVEKNGSGNFTKLIDAIEYAEQFMDSVVYVGAGTWDIIDELGNDYIESVSQYKRGVYLKNRIHLIFDSNSKVICNYTGDRSQTIAWLSAFNSGEYGFTLENATIEASNCRYVIHDERDSDEDFYINRYINCRMQLDNTQSISQTHPCIGGGLGKHGYIEIDGCHMQGSEGSALFYHNSASADAKSHIVVKNCWLNRIIAFNWYGQSQLITQVEVSGCSLGAAIVSHAETADTSPYQNISVTEWNNTIRT